MEFKLLTSQLLDDFTKKENGLEYEDLDYSKSLDFLLGNQIKR
jgi:hypothetical protein